MNHTALKTVATPVPHTKPSDRHLRVGATRLPLLPRIHEAIAAHHLHGSAEFVVRVTTDQRAPIPDGLNFEAPVRPGVYEVRYHMQSQYVLAKAALVVR